MRDWFLISGVVDLRGAIYHSLRASELELHDSMSEWMIEWMEFSCTSAAQPCQNANQRQTIQRRWMRVEGGREETEVSPFRVWMTPPPSRMQPSWQRSTMWLERGTMQGWCTVKCRPGRTPVRTELTSTSSKRCILAAVGTRYVWVWFVVKLVYLLHLWYTVVYCSLL